MTLIGKTGIASVRRSEKPTAGGFLWVSIDAVDPAHVFDPKRDCLEMVRARLRGKC